MHMASMRVRVQPASHGGHYEQYSPVQNAMCKRWDTPLIFHSLRRLEQFLHTMLHVPSRTVLAQTQCEKRRKGCEKNHVPVIPCSVCPRGVCRSRAPGRYDPGT